MNQCIRLTLPIAQFRGFTSQHANQVLLQPEESSQLIVVCLNNCEDGADRPTALGNFAKTVCDEILEKQITSFVVDYWKMPSTDKQAGVTTRADQATKAYRSSLVDQDHKVQTRYLGVIYLRSDRGLLDIRRFGLSTGSLVLKDKCNWKNETEDDRTKLEKIFQNQKQCHLKVYRDLRRMLPNYVQGRKAFQARVEVSRNVAGCLIGTQGTRVNKIAEECNVQIVSPKKEDEEFIFTIEGQAEGDVDCALSALREQLPPEAADGQPIIFEPSRVRQNDFAETSEEIFIKMKGTLCGAQIIGSKSISCYTLLLSGKVMEIELLGLQVITTRADNQSWLNAEATRHVVKDSLEYSANLVGSSVQVSAEAMGYSQGNTRRNMHSLMFHDMLNVNADIIRKGICKLMQSGRYYNPFTYRREEPVRSLFPYMICLLRSSRPHESNGLSWCKSEADIVNAERQAVREGLGLWQTCTPNEPLIRDRPTATSKRHLFIDNSNIWITGKHFSGERKGIGYLRAKAMSIKLQRNGEKYSKDDVYLGVSKDNRLRKFVCDRRSYNSSDHSWRLDIDRLLWLVGYESGEDPNFYVAGSVPPDNEDIWTALQSKGSINVLTNRTTEGTSSSEDTSLVNKIHKSLNSMKEEDDFILCAGDRGFRETLKDVRERFPRMRIFVVAWAHNAYHRLRNMDDENTFFINLDPYIDYLSYSSAALVEITGSLVQAFEEGRLVVADISRRDEVFSFLSSEPHHLLVDRDFKFHTNRKDKILNVAFTTVQKESGIVEECRTLFGRNDQKTTEAQPAARGMDWGFEQKPSNMFAALLDESDDDADENRDSDDEDGYNYDDDCDVVDNHDDYY
mmetsp:Transcript_18407/g.30679  ORF Transcript_18407/g.30679 Transcript_18407/m.30679 type:complete len:849 (+) Transcript_18407:55-2601(+)